MKCRLVARRVEAVGYGAVDGGARRLSSSLCLSQFIRDLGGMCLFSQTALSSGTWHPCELIGPKGLGGA